MANSERPLSRKQVAARLETGLNVGSVQDTREQDRETPQTPRVRKVFSPRIYEGRMLRAQDLREIHAEFKADGLRQFSPTACARTCKVDESVYRAWMVGEKPMPSGADEWLPWPVLRRLRERADSRRTKRGES